nr:hypothetical protein [candidate division Zixibacteria bacterium]
MADNNDPEKIAERIKSLIGWATPPQIVILTDTSDWMRIERGHILRLGDRDFLVNGHQYEKRFGISDQPKYWVFNVFDLESGERKIVKTVFHEDFHVHIGVFKIHCFRSPEKEARVLDIVHGDNRFMQGTTIMDDKNNHVRVIDFIRGRTFFQQIFEIEKSHERYFHEDLPDILRNLADSFEAIRFLHRNKTCHGDIRNDHIIIEADTGRYRWIDFDLNQNVSDFDIWSLGNIVNYAVGKGITTFKAALRDSRFPEEIRESLAPDDASGFFEYRLMNLGKLYPYIPEKLNDILLHFTIRPKQFYTNLDQFLDDYYEMLDSGIQ